MSTYVEPRTGSSSAVKPTGKNLAIQAPRKNTERMFKLLAAGAVLNFLLGWYGDVLLGQIFATLVLLPILAGTVRVHYKERRLRQNV